MGDVLNEAYGIVQCKECPWYKSCVTPMRFNAEDLKREMQQAAPGLGLNAGGDSNLLGNMAAVVQNLLLEGCPIFIKRLKSNQDLSVKIKQLMQNWGQQEK